MLFSNLVKSATLAASLAAAAPAHVHNEHKRDVVYVTETNVVVVTATVPQVIAAQDTTITLATVNTALAAQSSASTYVREAQGTAAPVVEAATTQGTTTAQAAATQAAKVEATTSTTSTSAVASTAAAASTPKGKGVTYSPYTASGQCKTLEEVKADFAKLSGYEIIRLYGVDCSQVEFVLQAKSSSQKLFLGIFFVDAIQAGISQMASAIASHGSWADVHTVSIGNELVNSGAASVSQIASYVAAGRSALTAAGYTGPVISVDTHVAVINNPGLCDISDYVGINAHAYFDYNTVAEDAGSWLLLQIQRVWSTCGGKKHVYVTESGWPHQGDTYGKAIASPSAQSAALSSIISTVGDDVILFTAFDDLWKADGAQNCEKYWGFVN